MLNDYQTLINILAGAGMAAVGWFCKSVWDAVTRLQAEIHRIELTLPTYYVRKDEFAESVKVINEKLDRIWEKLESKQDRS